MVGQIDELIGLVEEDEDKVEQAIADKKAENCLLYTSDAADE